MDYSKIDFDSKELKIPRTPISANEIERRMTSYGGFTKETVRLWGVMWPLEKGWKAALIKYGYPLFNPSVLPAPAPKISKSKKRKIEKQAKREAQKPRHFGGPSKDNKRAFYDSWDWRTLRKEILNEFGAVCQCCGARPGMFNSGGSPVRIVVDHVKPISRYWHLRLVRSNLQVLCDECNQGKGSWDETDHRPQEDDDQVPQSLIDQLTYAV